MPHWQRHRPSGSSSPDHHRVVRLRVGPRSRAPRRRRDRRAVRRRTVRDVPEWGVGGYSYGRHVVLVALDPAVELEERRITATLVHEFHHAMRERGPGCGGTLASMLVSEGLAQLFEEEVTGEAPFYSRVAITDEEIALAHDSLHSRPFSQSKWFFGADGITRSFGYTY